MDVAGLAGRAELGSRRKRTGSSLVSGVVLSEIPPAHVRPLEVAGLAGHVELGS